MDFKTILNKLGSNIKKSRFKRKLSQKEFSRVIKIDESFLSKIENGKSNFSIGYLQKIAKGLKTPVGDLCKDI